MSACDKLHGKSDFMCKTLSCDQIPHRITGDKVTVNMHTHIHYTHTTHTHTHTHTYLHTAHTRTNTPTSTHKCTHTHMLHPPKYDSFFGRRPGVRASLCRARTIEVAHAFLRQVSEVAVGAAWPTGALVTTAHQPHRCFLAVSSGDLIMQSHTLKPFHRHWMLCSIL